MITKIMSGGQTGTDRAALDFAIANGIPYGGWLPKGRKTEDGTLDLKYHLQEMPTTDYPKRTEKNVLDSEGTVIISHGLLTGGSALTREFSKKHQKHWIHIDLKELTVNQAAERLLHWIQKKEIKVLNVAGPRARKDPDIYSKTFELLKLTFIEMRQ